MSEWIRQFKLGKDLPKFEFNSQKKWNSAKAKKMEQTLYRKLTNTSVGRFYGLEEQKIWRTLKNNEEHSRTKEQTYELEWTKA